MTTTVTFFIPAGRGQARFEDDLLRKLDGISLIQRAIDKARELGGSYSSIHILTDSDEVALIARRNGVNVLSKPGLNLGDAEKVGDSREYIENAETNCDVSAVLSPYAPLLEVDTFKGAVNHLIKTRACVVQPVRTISRRVFDQDRHANVNGLLAREQKNHQLESTSFLVMRRGLLGNPNPAPRRVSVYEVDDSAFEIETLQDWWVCEKLLQRKRIIFYVIGNKRVGMGHVYRALSLAHELHDHEVLFVTDTQNQVAVEALVQRDYWLGVYSPEKVVDQLIPLSKVVLLLCQQ